MAASFNRSSAPANHKPTSFHRPSQSSIDATPARPSANMPSDRLGPGPLPMSHAQPPFALTAGGDAAGGPLRMAQSPPKNKNTQHVPCKFWLQGQCQAGRACPFSHDVESTTRPMPCKYFAKGGCKFGRKCALLHITPDGTVVNRAPSFPPAPQYMPAGPMPNGYGPAPPGLLSLQSQGMDPRANGDMFSDFDGSMYPPRNGFGDGPQNEPSHATTSTQFGSPPQNGNLATSPPHKGISVLDAPLPNSFDSNGISWMARYGPVAASVPSKFGLESAASSYARPQFGNSALRELHSSAFGQERGMDGVLAGMGSSPPGGAEEPLVFEKRSLHSARLRTARTPMFSTSLGTSLGTRPPPVTLEISDDEDDEDTDREGILLPSSLHDLIPESRPRRDSRTKAAEENSQGFLSASRRTVSGYGTPSESKVGSPHSSSPSRYTNVFQQRNQNVFGHVGSPLRDSSSALAASFASSTNGEAGTSLNSPPRQASMSILTQGLQRSKIDASRTTGPATSRSISNGSTRRTSLDRNVSSTSISQRIDEEQESGLFDMDGVNDALPRATHSSSGPSVNPWAAVDKTYGSSPRNESAFGPIGGQRHTPR